MVIKMDEFKNEINESILKIRVLSNGLITYGQGEASHDMLLSLLWGAYTKVKHAHILLSMDMLPSVDNCVVSEQVLFGDANMLRCMYDYLTDSTKKATGVSIMLMQQCISDIGEHLVQIKTRMNSWEILTSLSDYMVESGRD